MMNQRAFQFLRTFPCFLSSPCLSGLAHMSGLRTIFCVVIQRHRCCRCPTSTVTTATHQKASQRVSRQPFFSFFVFLLSILFFLFSFCAFVVVVVQRGRHNEERGERRGRERGGRDNKPLPFLWLSFFVVFLFCFVFCVFVFGVLFFFFLRDDFFRFLFLFFRDSQSEKGWCVFFVHANKPAKTFHETKQKNEGDLGRSREIYRCHLRTISTRTFVILIGRYFQQPMTFGHSKQRARGSTPPELHAEKQRGKKKEREIKQSKSLAVFLFFCLI